MKIFVCPECGGNNLEYDLDLEIYFCVKCKAKFRRYSTFYKSFLDDRSVEKSNQNLCSKCFSCNCSNCIDNKDFWLELSNKEYERFLHKIERF